jgi:hypothetical protein
MNTTIFWNIVPRSPFVNGRFGKHIAAVFDPPKRFTYGIYGAMTLKFATLIPYLNDMRSFMGVFRNVLTLNCFHTDVGVLVCFVTVGGNLWSVFTEKHRLLRRC